MNDAFWLTMRRLRTPLITLVLVYFFSVLAMISVPGEDAMGNPVRPGFLDAAYFVAIMSTTIGFGELPTPFTGAQRMVVLCIIFPNVVAWLYSIGAIIGLFLDPQFNDLLKRSRFGRHVRWLGEDFYVVCGFGNTGCMVVKGLLNRGLYAVALEKNPQRVQQMSIDDSLAQAPMLACDTTARENLELAGIGRANCRGVIVSTNEDHDNLTIAITVKLLEPRLKVFARSESQRVSANMASFGTDYVVNPYEIFAERLFLALTSPVKYEVQDWLISVPGDSLRPKRLEPPMGRWIVCGAGRFGERMLEKLEEGGLPYTVIEVHPDRVERYPGSVLGRGTEAQTLEEARIGSAVGIIASTGDDIDNLSIVMTARELNEDLFIVARQEQQENDDLFNRCGAHIVAKRSKIVARRILAVATTPMLETFMEHLVRANDEFAEQARARLEAVLRGFAPSLWVIELTGSDAECLRRAREEELTLELRHLEHDARGDNGGTLPCVCLVLERGAQRFFLPGSKEPILKGDRLLFAGRSYARREMERSLYDPLMLLDYATPGPVQRTAIGRWLARRRSETDGTQGS